jgi:hypothetical protein
MAITTNKRSSAYDFEKYVAKHPRGPTHRVDNYYEDLKNPLRSDANHIRTGTRSGRRSAPRAVPGPFGNPRDLARALADVTQRDGGGPERAGLPRSPPSPASGGARSGRRRRRAAGGPPTAIAPRVRGRPRLTRRPARRMTDGRLFDRTRDPIGPIRIADYWGRRPSCGLPSGAQGLSVNTLITRGLGRRLCRGSR